MWRICTGSDTVKRFTATSFQRESLDSSPLSTMLFMTLDPHSARIHSGDKLPQESSSLESAEEGFLEGFLLLGIELGPLAG